MRQNSKSKESLQYLEVQLNESSCVEFPDQWEVNLRLMAQPSTNEQKLSASLTTSHSWIQQHIFSDIKSLRSLHCHHWLDWQGYSDVNSKDLVQSPFPPRRSLFIPSHWFIDPLICLLKANDVSKWVFQFESGCTPEARGLRSKDNST